jgi:hypothetical protein
VATGPQLNTLQPELAYGAGPTSSIEAQHSSHGQMAYQQRVPDVEEKTPKGQKDGCSQLAEGCAIMTCTTLLVTWAATIAACQVTICMLDCMTYSYY